MPTPVPSGWTGIWIKRKMPAHCGFSTVGGHDGFPGGKGSALQDFFPGQRVGDAQQGQNDRHADVNAVVHLIEVGGTRVVIHILFDLVDRSPCLRPAHKSRPGAGCRRAAGSGCFGCKLCRKTAGKRRYSFPASSSFFTSNRSLHSAVYRLRISSSAGARSGTITVTKPPRAPARTPL